MQGNCYLFVYYTLNCMIYDNKNMGSKVKLANVNNLTKAEIISNLTSSATSTGHSGSDRGCR